MSKKKKSISLRSFILGFLSGVLFSGILVFLITKSSLFDQTSLLAMSSTSPQVSINNNPEICLTNSSSKISLLDINQATSDELNSLPGIGQVKAGNIIAWREKYGNFKEISELIYVSGISDNIFQGLCDLITVR